jgi:hypothetical protein
MAQELSGDFPIDPNTTSGTALADILNRFEQAVMTSNSGASPPPGTYAGMMWLDTSVAPSVMRVRNSANTGWDSIPVSSGDGAGSPFLLPDGTAASPGLAWASEPGLGLYRVSSDGNIAVAKAGLRVAMLGTTSTDT